MKTFAAWSVLFALAALPASGQAPAGAPLTLDDCLRAADHHPLVAAAAAGVTAAGEAVRQARAPYWPAIDLSAGYHRWQRRAFLPSGLSIPGQPLPLLIGPLDDWTAGLSSRVTLLDFGGRRAGLDAARAQLGGAEADAAATRADVRLAVESAFYAAAAAQDLLGVATRNLARTESHLALAQARRDAGAVPQADVLRVQAEVAAARLDLIGARSRVLVATGALNTAMGRPAETPLAIAPPEGAAPPAAPADLAAATDAAIAHRPELRAEQRRVAAARAAVSGARAARAPTLLADASYGWNDTALLPQTKEWQVGVAVSVPVFDGGSRAHRVAQRRAELTRAQAAYDQHVLQVRQEVWAAAAELERAWEAIAANETTVRADEESLRVVRERYQSGAALVTDLLDTQTALAGAESSLAAARWTYLTARAAYARSVGAGL